MHRIQNRKAGNLGLSPVQEGDALRPLVPSTRPSNTRPSGTRRHNVADGPDAGFLLRQEGRCSTTNAGKDTTETLELQKEKFAKQQRLLHGKGLRPKPTRTTRICTWNVHFYRHPVDERDTYKGILLDVALVDADVLCLQEVPDLLSSEPLTVIMLRELGYAHCSWEVASKSHNGLGNLVASKVPHRKIYSGCFGELAHTLEDRSFVGIDIGAFDLWCTHLDVWDPSGGTRLRQMRKLLGQARPARPTVLVGDFNCPFKRHYDPPTWRLLQQAHGQYTQKEYGTRYGFDQSLFHALERERFCDLAIRPVCYSVWSGYTVDHCFGRRMQAVDSWTFHTPYSDHLPVVFDVLTITINMT